MIQSLKSKTDDLSQQLLQHLTDKGARSTRARASVLHALAAHSGGFTIEDLCGETRPVGRATVYRTVRLLVEEGLVCKLAMGDTTPRYSLARPGHHHHAVCVRCGAIEDFRGCDIDELVQKLSAAAGSQAIGHRLEVYVVCARCSNSKAADSTKARPTARPAAHKHTED